MSKGILARAFLIVKQEKDPPKGRAAGVRSPLGRHKPLYWEPLGASLLSGWPKRVVSEVTIMPRAVRAAHVWYYYVIAAR
jgi:hypothetical protein